METCWKAESLVFSLRAVPIRGTLMTMSETQKKKTDRQIDRQTEYPEFHPAENCFCTCEQRHSLSPSLSHRARPRTYVRALASVSSVSRLTCCADQIQRDSQQLHRGEFWDRREQTADAHLPCSPNRLSMLCPLSLSHEGLASHHQRP